jgi:hypothetical protein
MTLSCYTANLAAYLAADFPDVPARIAGTVRLAVRVDSPLPAFSHHSESLAGLPDGGHLAYQAAAHAQDALTGIEDELRRYGRVLVVANSGRLPWTPGYGTSSAMHWLLVDDQEAGRWHVTDRFAALLPEGEQRCHSGWLTADDLAGALEAGDTPSPQAHLRDVYAFGFPVAVPPAGRPRWLVRQRGPGPAPVLPGSWTFGPAALAYLADWFRGENPDAAGSFEDLWTAARHHEHMFAWQSTTGRIGAAEAAQATDVWWQLVRSVRFALDSARRGRPRLSMIDKAFGGVMAVAG